jgi:hypothetical protein
MFALVLASCSLAPSKHIYTEVNIGARASTIWRILKNNAGYPAWNPYHVKVEGKLVVGRKLLVDIHKPNGQKVSIKPRVLRIRPMKELTWGGGIKGIFHGEHRFILVKISDCHTKLIQQEDFTGVTVRFASLDAIEEGYILMNNALKHRAELQDARHCRNFPSTRVRSSEPVRPGK